MSVEPWRERERDQEEKERDAEKFIPQLPT